MDRGTRERVRKGTEDVSRPFVSFAVFVFQILTVAELLAGKRIDAPPLGQTSITFKKAPRAKGEGDKLEQLPLQT